MSAAPAFRIQNEPSLARLTSIGLGGTAVAEVRLSGSRGFEQLGPLLRVLGGRMAVLGGGTNIMAADRAHEVVLVTQEAADEPRLRVEEDGGRTACFLEVDAGTRLARLLSLAAERGLSGLEGLAGIPGSVGGALAGNAGSFGVEIGSLLHEARIFTPGGGLETVRGAAFDFAYRSCRLKGRDGVFLFARATFALVRGESVMIRQRMHENLARKKAAQPVGLKSAGCVFKNPAPDAPAGRLLEEAGLKGRREGGMRFSPLHANFLVNEDQGTFDQAMTLVELAREKVRALSGHRLETEVRLWP